MKLRFLLVGFLSVLLLPVAMAQVVFNARPVSMQLYPRDANDSATVTVSGLVNANGFANAIFTMHKNGVLADSSTLTLNYNNGNAPFEKNYKIHAEKSNYRFKMYLFKGNTATLVNNADSVCSGDAYIVTGQSNAVAVANGPGNDPLNVWIRSFGTQSNVDVTCLADTAWGMANGANSNSRMSIGVWAMRLARMFADTTGIPVCVINGGRTSSKIIDHLPLTDHADVSSYYGRLFYRAQKAHVEGKAKALFWYQGESDGDIEYLNYAGRFAQLYNAWKQDYSSLQKIVVIQTRPGCIISPSMQYHQQLREVLRSLENVYPDVTLSTTVGLPEFDGCHFTTAGYQALATQLYYQFCDEFIGKPEVPGSNPPHLVSAIYTNNDNTEISLIYDQDVAWPNSFNGYNMRDYLYLNCSSGVVNGSACHDTLKLQLSASTNADKFSYLPPIYYAGTTDVYQGPWLTNARNVGAPAFYQFTISNNLVITADRNPSICSGDSVILSTTRTGQSYQWYQNGGLIMGATQQQYVAKVSGVYNLVMKDADNLSVSSNSITVSNAATVKPVITSSNGKGTLCAGRNLTLYCNQGATFLWSTGETTSSISVSDSGNYTVSITTANGCSGVSDTFKVVMDMPAKPVIVSDKAGICEGDSAKLTSGNYSSFLWSNGSNQPSIYVKDSGYYSITVNDSVGCAAVSDSVSLPLRQTPAATVNSSSSRACPGQSISVYSASPATFYLWSTGVTTSGISVNTTGVYTLTVTDQYGCKGVSAGVSLTISAPAITISPTGNRVICSGTSQLLTATVNASPGTFQWYKGKSPIANSNNSTYAVSSAGNYTVVFTDSYGCSASSTATVITVSPLPAASFTITDDLDFCNDSLVTLTANAGAGLSYQWQKNMTDMPGANNQVYATQTKGSYRVIVTNNTGCSKTSTAKTVPLNVPLPVASFTVSDQFDNCMDSVVTLTAASATAYQWQNNLVNIPGANDEVYVTQAKGSYRLITTNAAGCTKASSTKAIPIIDPTATVRASGSLTICAGDSVVLTANAGSGYTYEWLQVSTPIAGAVEQSYAAKTTGSFRVRVTNSIGCTALSGSKSVKVNNCGSRISSDVSNETEDQLSVYPQPFSKEFMVQLPADEADNSDYSLEIRNIAGALVLQVNKVIFNDNEATVNAEVLEPGVYFYFLKSSKHFYRGRLMKN